MSPGPSKRTNPSFLGSEAEAEPRRFVVADMEIGFSGPMAGNVKPGPKFLATAGALEMTCRSPIVNAAISAAQRAGGHERPSFQNAPDAGTLPLLPRWNLVRTLERHENVRQATSEAFGAWAPRRP
jgi:hypothetical protein